VEAREEQNVGARAHQLMQFGTCDAPEELHALLDAEPPRQPAQASTIRTVATQHQAPPRGTRQGG
jgi:hypothetical protein